MPSTFSYYGVDSDPNHRSPSRIGVNGNRGGTYDVIRRRAHNERLPVFAFPPEILVQIFSYTLDDMPSLASVLLCSQICSKWRETAWSASGLWSKICFNFEYSEYDKPIRPITLSDMDQLKEWMSRTGPASHPLFLSIKCSIFSFRVPPVCPFVEPHRLMHFLGEHRHRWKRLELCIPYHWFARFQALTFPALESIKFTAFHTDPTILTGCSLEHSLYNWKVPSLRSVKLYGIKGHQAILPWSQLHHIRIEETRPKGFFDILHLCKEVVELKVGLVWGAYQRNLGLTLASLLHQHEQQLFVRADLPLLERLRIICEEPGFAATILGKVVAPRLQVLSMNLFKAKLEPNLPLAIEAFVKKCKLRRLVFEVDYMNSQMSESDAQAFCGRLADRTLIPIELRASKFTQ